MNCLPRWQGQQGSSQLLQHESLASHSSLQLGLPPTHIPSAGGIDSTAPTPPQKPISLPSMSKFSNGGAAVLPHRPVALVMDDENDDAQLLDRSWAAKPRTSISSATSMASATSTCTTADVSSPQPRSIACQLSRARPFCESSSSHPASVPFDH